MTKNKNETATAVPRFTIHHNGTSKTGVFYLMDGEKCVATFNGTKDGKENAKRITEDEARRSLILQAINQFEALQAVADAAESVLPFIQRIRSSHNDGGNTIADNLLNSIANLQTVRGGKAVQS